MTALRLAVFLAYLPVLGALGLLIWQCVFLMIRLQPAGLFGLLYLGVFWLLARRAARVVRGGLESLWPDLLAACAADVLLAVIFIR